MHLGVRLLGRHAGLETRCEIEPLVGVILRIELLGVQRERGPDVGSPEEGAESLRHHAQYRVALRIQLHRLADDAAVSAVDALPQAVAQDNDTVLSLLVLVAAEDSA